MRKLFLSLLPCLLSVQVYATEYQKMFRCSRALKTEGQSINKAIAKNYTVLPTKIMGAEGVSLFLQDKVYFCKLPKKFVSKNVDERLFKMNLDLPNLKPIYLSYLKSTTEAPSLEVMDWDENMDFKQSQRRPTKSKMTTCSESRDPHNEKVLAEFLRKEISHIHDNASGVDFSMSPRDRLSTLRVCEKSFLLRSISTNEIKKFERRIPANTNDSDLIK